MRLLQKFRKRKITVPPDFVPATNLHYVKFLRELHEKVLFDWYMEVGCRSGASIAPVRGKTIGVDPFFQVNLNAIGQKPALHFFQEKSDVFFQSGFLRRADIKLSLTFLDGMHLIEYLLRDFCNTEANSTRSSVIMIHDCCPYDHGMTTRDLTIIDDLPRKIWTGDVWKIIPILQKYRPDLLITVLDCANTGLVMVSNLSPESTVLKEQSQEILAEFLNLDLQAFGAAKFFGSFKFTDARKFLNDNTDFWKDLAMAKELATVPKKVSL